MDCYPQETKGRIKLTDRDWVEYEDGFGRYSMAMCI